MPLPLEPLDEAALEAVHAQAMRVLREVGTEVHHDGMIWSHALWNIRGALGATRADTVILQGSFDFPGTTMTDLANRTVAAAQFLYGSGAAGKVTKAFEDRGILE